MAHRRQEVEQKAKNVHGLLRKHYYLLMQVFTQNYSRQDIHLKYGVRLFYDQYLFAKPQS